MQMIDALGDKKTVFKLKNMTRNLGWFDLALILFTVSFRIF
jgi:hypothetical protein